MGWRYRRYSILDGETSFLGCLYKCFQLILGGFLVVLTLFFILFLDGSSSSILNLVLIGILDLLLILALVARRIIYNGYVFNPWLTYLTIYAIVATIFIESFFIIKTIDGFYDWIVVVIFTVLLSVLWLLNIAIYKMIKKIINHFREKKAAKVQEEIKAYEKRRQDRYNKLFEIRTEPSQNEKKFNEKYPTRLLIQNKELTPREKIEKKHGKLLIDIAYYLLKSQKCSRKDLQVEFRESEMNIRYALKDLEKYHIIEAYGNGRYNVTTTSEDDLLTKLDVAQESTGSEDYDSNLALADPTYAYLDPLFKEVVGFILYWQEINVKKIRLHFGIGLNRTLAMLKTMKELGIIDYRGNYHEIKMTEEEVNNLFNNNQTTNN